MSAAAEAAAGTQSTARSIGAPVRATASATDWYRPPGGPKSRGLIPATIPGKPASDLIIVAPSLAGSREAPITAMPWGANSGRSRAAAPAGWGCSSSRAAVELTR